MGGLGSLLEKPQHSGAQRGGQARRQGLWCTAGSTWQVKLGAVSVGEQSSGNTHHERKLWWIFSAYILLTHRISPPRKVLPYPWVWSDVSISKAYFHLRLYSFFCSLYLGDSYRGRGDDPIGKYFPYKHKDTSLIPTSYVNSQVFIQYILVSGPSLILRPRFSVTAR